jgi:hypothetical protein
LGAPQRQAVALGVEVGHLSARWIEPLDPAADVAVGVERAGHEEAADLERRETSAVVAQVQRAIRTQGQAVGPPRTSASVVFVPSAATRVMRGPKISTTSTTVGHRDRTLGEAQPERDLDQGGLAGVHVSQSDTPGPYSLT